MKSFEQLKEYWKSKEYTEKLIQLENEGLTHSDAQALLDAEFLKKESEE